MTPQELDAIRARGADNTGFMWMDELTLRQSHSSAIADRRALLAEVDRLTELKTPTLEALTDDAAMALARRDERARIRAGVEGLATQPGWK